MEQNNKMTGQRRYLLRQSMRQRVDEKERDALTAIGEELWRLIRDQHHDRFGKCDLD
jgi:hypothetical protein